MALLFIEELSQTFGEVGRKRVLLQGQQRGAEHFLLEEGDLLIEVERVELVVAQECRGREQAIRGRMK